jgi:hypothetical protein
MRSLVQRAHNKLAQLRDERGATDPILVIASIAITLALLLGGTFMITQVISNAKNLNAKSDLDKISVVEASLYASQDQYLAYDSVTDHGGQIEKPTAVTGGIGFSPTSGGKVAVTLITTPTGGVGWAATSKSTGNTKDIYIKTSESSKTVTVAGGASLTHVGGTIQAADLATLGITAATVDALITAANDGVTP